MEAFFLQQLINGLTLGAVYGLIAIGYTMVYGIIGMINFAHGEVYMISAYLCAIGLALLSGFGIHSFPLLIFGTLVFTIVVTGVYGWTIERIAYRPLRNSTRLAPLISAIGMSLILQNYVQISQGPNQQGIPTLLSGVLRFEVGDGIVQITWTKIFILVAALVGMIVLTWIIQHTRLGRICRATQQDRRMAAILGINTDRVISLVFVIGAAMAGLAGVLVTMNYGTFDFYIGFIIGIKAFTAAVLGDRLATRRDARRFTAGGGRSAVRRLVNSDYKDVFFLRAAGGDPYFPPASCWVARWLLRFKGSNMAEVSRKPGLDIRRCLIDSILAGLCALIVFGPIVGIVLKGYSYNLSTQRVLILVGIVMIGRLLLSLLLQSRSGRQFLARFEGTNDGVYVRPAGYRSRLRWVIPLLALLAILFPIVATKYLLTVAILGLIYVLLGLGLNIVVGLAGLLDLGYVAFYAIGAYGLALGYQYLGLGFWAMLPAGAIMAALAGALLGFPVLRMHGDYLAIVTLGFGEIIRLVLNNWVSFTGGPNGVSVPAPTLFGLEFGRRAKDGGVPIHEFLHISYNPNLKFIFIYAVLCLVVLLVLFIKHRLTRMPIGRAWEALREDEIACRAMGLNHVLVKLSAFMLGASTAGIAGVFFCHLSRVC